MTAVPASRTTALKSAPTYPCACPATNVRSSSVNSLGVLARRTRRIAARADASGKPVPSSALLGLQTRSGSVPISISRSSLPGLRSAWSIAFGLFVVATTTTLSSASSENPSRSVRSVATTRCSTSLPPPPVSDRAGHRASSSSRITIHGLYYGYHVSLT
jgi:hypothetical protein